MLTPFVCGSFHEEDDPSSSPSSTPKKSCKKSSKDKNNPFSTRGLDEFNTLLADLEEKRQKIYSELGSEDLDNAMVRFVFKSSSNDVVPIVIRLKDRKQVKSKSGELVRENIKDNPTNHNTKPVEKLSIEAGQVPDEKEVKLTRLESHQEKTENTMFNFNWNFKLKNWRRPSFYVPVAIVLILLFLVFFGRSVAILCTSIGWYLVPTLSSTPKKTIAKNKEYLRGNREIKMVNSRLSTLKSSNYKAVAAGKSNWHRQTDHRKSF